MFDDNDIARRDAWSAQNKLRRAENALRGDPKAKAQIEAEEIGTDARNAVNALQDKAAKGDKAAMSQLRSIAKGTAPKASAAASTVPSKAVVDVAVKAAVKRERQRVATVFASKHSRGRERACVGILSAPESYSAETIVAQLPSISLDAQVEARVRQQQLDRHASTWDRARRAATDGPGTKAKASPEPVANDPWAKAYAKIDGERAA